MQNILRIILGVIIIGGIALLIWANSPSTPSSHEAQVPSATSTLSTTSSQTPPAAPSAGAAFKSVMTTYFYVGEPSDADNAYIPNDVSYWDDAWMQHFGGIDDPNNRCGYNPCSFTPLENPFYFALPYGEFDEDGNLKASSKSVPWYREDLSPLLKNHWIEVRHDGHTCFAQWEDVGPNNEDDFSYVFGSSNPTNTFGEKAGLDVSPALWKCLGMDDNDITSWRFVDASSVPSGPWKETVTSSPISWGN